MNPREAFLERVRQAVAQGNRPGVAAPLGERGRIGYQGAGEDLVARFCTELTAAGGQPLVAPTSAAVWHTIREIIERHGARKIAIGAGGMIERLDIAARLQALGLEIIATDSLGADRFRESMFAADLGISNVAYLIAETGSIVAATAPHEPRSLSLLPPVHIALAHRDQLLPDLFDLFDLYSPVADLSRPATPPPSCMTLITGPSKTGDIELKLVTGVHGPGEVHVIVCGE